MSLFQTFPIIANCDIAICNDSSFSHLSAAIGIQNYSFNGGHAFIIWEL